MSPLVALLVSLPLLVLNYKWALVDPHDPGGGPGWSAAVFNALWVTVLFAAALAAHGEGYARMAAFTSSFAFGTAISPSIAPPYALTAAEEPRRLWRFAKSRLHGMRVISIKMLLLFPVSWLIDPVVAQQRSFFASGLIALFFSLVKAAYLGDLLREPELRSAYARARHRLLAGTVRRTCALGSLGLLAWLAAIYPVIDAFPEPQLDDYAMLAAFAFGLLLRPS